MAREIDTQQAPGEPGLVSHLIALSFSLTVVALFAVYLAFS